MQKKMLEGFLCSDLPVFEGVGNKMLAASDDLNVRGVFADAAL